MKLSWRWLTELADLSSIPLDEVERLLPLRVADLEGVERLGSLDGVVTAKVLQVEPHPNADRLRLCTVDYGAATVLRVVCGAPNVAAGQTVCFAKVGTTLPGGLTLKKAKIRGVDSEGMICAQDELGIGTDHAGIIVLPEGTPVGKPAAEVLGLSDAVLDVNNAGITSRPDLWGHVGFARELAAIFSRPLRLPGVAKAEAALGAVKASPFPLSVEDPEGCRRYVGVVIEGLTNGTSPDAARRRLEILGLRSVDRLVDLTNLTMLEQGQPLHAFDLREVRGGRIVVRRAKNGETLRTLDGKDLRLVDEDLVIADAERVLALAGVMGGEASGVRADTTAIVLESACFDAARVRRSAIRHGLRTDASTRFEKSLDPVGARTAALRFVEQVLESTPTARVVKAADAFPRPYPATSIDLPFDLVRRRLGWPVPDAEIVEQLRSVGFESKSGVGRATVAVPSWRATKDVAIPEDLVEEVGRLSGYENVRVEPPLTPMSVRRPIPARALERDGRAILCLDLGYAEIAFYAFHGAAEASKLGIDPERLLRLANPLSAEQDRLQVTCLQNLLGIALRNQPREATLRLCEWTRIFPKGERAAKALPAETPVVGLLYAERDRVTDPRGETFLAAKDDVVALLDRLGVGPLVVSDAGDATLHEGLPPPAWLHPGRRAAIRCGGVVLALVGELLPSTARAWGLVGRVAVGEVNLARVLAAGRSGRLYAPVPRFPTAPFDVAVVVPKRTPSSEVERVLRGAAPDAIRDVALFDVYEGKGIPEGQRSLAFTVTLGDADATLQPKTIERLQGRCLDALRRAGWTVRTGEAGPATGTGPA